MRKLEQGKYDPCKDRSIGHDWFLTDVERKSSFGTPVWHMCSRCSTIRKRILDITGRVTAQWYKHPMDYKYEFDAGMHRLLEVQQFRRRQREIKETQNT